MNEIIRTSIENIEINQNGLVQIDLMIEGTLDRAFCEPGRFFGMIGQSMQENIKRIAKPVTKDGLR